MPRRPPPQLRVPLMSPSALKVGRCERAMGFKKIDRIEPERGPWLAEGDRMHSHLERAALGEELDMQDPEQMIAAAAIPYWPERLRWRPEREILLERDGFAYWGFSDQLGPLFVGDYKFTGKIDNLPGYVKGMPEDELIDAAAEKLLDDEQWIVYANATNGDDDPHGQWTYVIKPPKRKGVYHGEPHVIPVRFSASRVKLRRQLSALDERSLHLIETRALHSQLVAPKRLTRKTARGNTVPHNADAVCQGIGLRCDFSDWCILHEPGLELREN